VPVELTRREVVTIATDCYCTDCGREFELEDIPAGFGGGDFEEGACPYCYAEQNLSPGPRNGVEAVAGVDGYGLSLLHELDPFEHEVAVELACEGLTQLLFGEDDENAGWVVLDELASQSGRYTWLGGCNRADDILAAVTRRDGWNNFAAYPLPDGGFHIAAAGWTSVVIPLNAEAFERARMIDSAAKDAACKPQLSERVAFDLERALLQAGHGHDDFLECEPYLWVWEAALEVAVAPTVELTELAGSDNEDIRWAVACREDCPAEALAIVGGFAFDPEPTHMAVAAHPSTPPATLQAYFLPGATGLSVRQAAMLNPACPPTLIETRVRDEYDDYRFVAAKNPSCPPAALRMLANDDDPEVRSDVARHPSCPRDVLMTLPTGVLAEAGRIDELLDTPGQRHIAASLVADCALTTVELLETARLLDDTDQIERTPSLHLDRAPVRRRKPQMGMTLGL